jgi:hypothetical protein
LLYLDAYSWESCISIFYLCLKSLHDHQVANTRNCVTIDYKQQQCQPTSTTHTIASINDASSNAANYSTNHAKHAASTTISTSAIATAT